MIRVGCLVALALTVGGRVEAQGLPEPTRPAGNVCSTAVTTLTAGNIAQRDSQERALTLMLACTPERSTAVPTAMERRRNVTDTMNLQSAFALPLRDGAVLDKALDIAGDPAASEVARIASWRLLLSFTDASAIGDDDEFLHTQPGSVCLVPRGSDAPGLLGSFSSTTLERIRDLGTQIQASPAELLSIRSAANCVLNSWRRFNGWHSAALGALRSTDLHGAWVCDSRFRLTNQSDVEAAVRIEGVGVTFTGNVWVPGKAAGQSSGELLIQPPVAGTFRVLFDGLLVQTLSSSGSC